MPLLLVETREGVEIAVNGNDGYTVMEMIRDAGLEGLTALCGGCCSCATCHVYVDASFVSRLPPMSKDENDLLDSSNDRRPESRLACQLRFNASLSGLKVTIAPDG